MLTNSRYSIQKYLIYGSSLSFLAKNLVFKIFFSTFVADFNINNVLYTYLVRKIYGILVLTMMVCVACQWQLKPSAEDVDSAPVRLQRYDRIESLYLTTGDYSALQQMNTYFPMETRLLIEDMLHLGQVNDPEINVRFLRFFQDSTLQQMLDDVQMQYANVDDIDEELARGFENLKNELPNIDVPVIYTQIGSFDESIIVSGGKLGVSLDKYLGSDYPFYQTHYDEDQRRMMKRDMIVPDCLSFYLLSLFPLSTEQDQNQHQRDEHMGRIMWTVNHLLGRMVFDNPHVSAVEEYMLEHASTTILQLLQQK